jgi:hypothetical protein
MTPFEMIFWPLWICAVIIASDDKRMIEWQCRFTERVLDEINGKS